MARNSRERVVAFSNWNEVRNQPLAMSALPFGNGQTWVTLAGDGSAIRKDEDLLLTLPPHSVTLIEAR
jgi:hypothetical protein